MKSAGGCSTMPGCSSSGLRPNGVVPGAAAMNGFEPSSKTVSAANTADTAQSTITAAPVRRSRRFEVAQRDHHGDDGEQEQPEQERALLAGPEARDAVEDREARVGVLGDVGEAEVLLEEGGQEDGARDHGAEEEGVDGVVAVADQVPALPAHAEGEEEHPGEGEDERKDEGQAAEIDHAGALTAPRRVPSASSPGPRTWTGTSSGARRRRSGPRAAEYWPMTTTSTPASNVFGIWPL